MKLTVKKAVALVLVLLLMFVTACSNNSGQTANDKEASGGDAKAEVTQEAKTEDKTEAEDKTESTGSLDERVSLSILAPAIVGIIDYETNDFTKWLEDKVNVDLSFQTVPDQGGEEKIQIILSSGDIPDILMSLGLNNAMITKYGVDEEMFLQLDDYMEKYAPNMQKSLANFKQGIGSMRMIDGHFYSMPVFDICQHCENSAKMWVYQPWLDKLEIPVPTTTDEFYQMLKAFKDNDPNGNGKADEIPLNGCAFNKGWHNDIQTFLMNAFVYYDRGSNANGMYVDNYQVKNALESEEYREGLRFLNKLYTEGLIYENAMTQDNPALVKQVENQEIELVGAVPGGFVGMFANLGGERGSQFRPISPVKGPSGYQNTPLYPSYAGSGDWVISADCENPIRAVQLADAMYEMEPSLDIRAGGMKDNFWREANDGELGFDGNPAKWYALKPWQDKDPQNESWIQVGVWDYTDLRVSQATDTAVDLWSLAGNEYMLYKVTMEMYAPFTHNMAVPPMQFEVEDQEQVAVLMTQLNTLMESSEFNFITGISNLDSDWDKYLADLKKLSDPLLKYYQAGYDRQYR